MEAGHEPSDKGRRKILLSPLIDSTSLIPHAAIGKTTILGLWFGLADLLIGRGEKHYPCRPYRSLIP